MTTIETSRKDDRLLRTETCLNDTCHLDIGRRLENLPVLVERMAQTNQRYLAARAELLANAVDTGQFVAPAQPPIVGQRRILGPRLHHTA